MFCDLALMTFLAVVPNPWSTVNWPVGMQFRFDTFIYFFVCWPPRRLPIPGERSSRWASGRGLWAVGVGWAWLQPETHAALSERVRAAVGADDRMFALIDPAAIGIPARFQEITCS